MTFMPDSRRLQVIGISPLHPVLTGGVADDLPLLGGIHMVGVDPERHPVLLPQPL